MINLIKKYKNYNSFSESNNIIKIINNILKMIAIICIPRPLLYLKYQFKRGNFLAH